MNAALNGTGWGESPVTELKFPKFMSEPYFDDSEWDENYNEARIVEAVSRERRKVRMKRKRQKELIIGTIAFIGLMVFLAVVGEVVGI